MRVNRIFLRAEFVMPQSSRAKNVSLSLAALSSGLLALATVAMAPFYDALVSGALGIVFIILSIIFTARLN